MCLWGLFKGTSEQTCPVGKHAHRTHTRERVSTNRVDSQYLHACHNKIIYQPSVKPRNAQHSVFDIILCVVCVCMCVCAINHIEITSSDCWLHTHFNQILTHQPPPVLPDHNHHHHRQIDQLSQRWMAPLMQIDFLYNCVGHEFTKRVCASWKKMKRSQYSDWFNAGDPSTQCDILF